MKNWLLHFLKCLVLIVLFIVIAQTAYAGIYSPPDPETILNYDLKDIRSQQVITGDNINLLIEQYKTINNSSHDNKAHYKYQLKENYKNYLLLTDKIKWYNKSKSKKSKADKELLKIALNESSEYTKKFDAELNQLSNIKEKKPAHKISYVAHLFSDGGK